MSTKRVKVAVLGSLIYDCVLWGPRLPRKGETITGYRSGFFTGGKGANQAVQLARLGADVYMIGKVGADDPGKILLDSLKRSGVNTDFLTVDDSEKSGTCAIMVDDNGDNIIMTAPAANMTIRREEIDPFLSKLSGFDLILTQFEINIDIVAYALDFAKEIGCPIVLNPAPAVPVPDRIFEGITYLTPNETETWTYTGITPTLDNKEEIEEAAERLITKGVHNVVLTLGSSGSFFWDGSRRIYTPAYKIKAVDATAAGDAFNAAFAYKVAAGEKIETALLYANAAGAVAASRAGAQPSLGTAEELEQFLADQK